MTASTKALATKSVVRLTASFGWLYQTSTFTVQVTPARPPISVSVTPNAATVQLSKTQTFTANVANDLDNLGVTWQVNGTAGGNATNGSISPAGVYTAPNAMPVSSQVTIAAVSVANSTKSATATITLSHPPVSVSINPVSASVRLGQKQSFTANIANDLQNLGVTWQVNGTTGGNALQGTISTAGVYTAPVAMPVPSAITITAISVADSTKSATATVSLAAAPAANSNLDRIDFGNASSEAAHNFDGGDNSPQTKGVGAFNQTYRQPRLVAWPNAPTIPAEQLKFTLAVDPTHQNYLTVKLFGSDTQFGVLKVLQIGTINPASGSTPASVASPAGELDQLDNNVSNGSANPPAYGMFHFATVAIPQTLTQGKTSVTLTLYSTGYFYSNGAGSSDTPTRPVYSAFSHINPLFVPPASDANGTPATVLGYTPPSTITAAQVYTWKKNNRIEIFDPPNSGFTDGFFHPDGYLYDNGICPLDDTTPGVPPEVYGLSVAGLSYGNYPMVLQTPNGGGEPTQGPPTSCMINPAAVAAINATSSPADTWRNMIASGQAGQQAGGLDVDLGVYFLPPLKDQSGNVVTGMDDYHDPQLLKRMVGVLDGLTRMQGSAGSWDTGCLDNSNSFPSAWGGITTTPRRTGDWAGSTARHDAGCISFDGSVAEFTIVMLRLLNDPYSGPLFQQFLAAPFDANLNGNLAPRAYAYEKMLAFSKDQMGFNPTVAPYTNNAFDKGGFTETQGLLFQQVAYSGQVGLRALLALYPNSDPAAQPLDSSLMTSIVQQFLGLEDPIVLNPVGVDWRTITAAGLGETYGTLSSGYDGRYGNYEAPGTANLVYLSQWDTTLTAAQRQAWAGVVRNCISAYDHFMYPQQRIDNGAAYWTYAPEDVISYRVPYGPNADGGSNNWFVQLAAADPNGPIQSAYARRAFYFGSLQTYGSDAMGLGVGSYPTVETLWNSMIGEDPATLTPLPAEPNQPDFAWADIENGAVSIQYQGERLLFNSQYNRPQGKINNVVRLHYITSNLDREASIMMPYDSTTVQDDGNLSEDVNGAWVIRYGRYLVVLNRGRSAYTVTLPSGIGNAVAMQSKNKVPLGSTSSVAANSYEVFVIPQ